MIAATPHMRILLAVAPVDFRKGIDGLAAVCRQWNWVQPNGALRDMVCRSLMLELHRAGHIRLPEKKRAVANPLAERKKPEPIPIDQKPIQAELCDLKPLEFRQVRRSEQEKLFNSLVEQFHYLGYCHPVGEQLKYIVCAHKRPIACLCWSSAPRHIGCRDRFIGWSQQTRKKNISLMAYNSRFLILPWVHVPSLASHLLARMARVLAADWQRIYNHGIYYLETFVDKKAASIRRLLRMLFGAATEKLEKAEQAKKSGASGNKPKKGHGRNPASDYTGAEKVEVDHDTLKPGDNCPVCFKGKVYEIKEPKKVVRITGNAPLSATVYEMQRLRCNLCGEIFTADTPEGVGDAKYDARSAAVIAVLKYGTGMPFNRLENLQQNLGIPLAASTQFEIVDQVAAVPAACRRKPGGETR